MNEWLERWYETPEGDTWLRVTSYYEEYLASVSATARGMAVANLEILDEQLAYVINDHYHEWIRGR